MKSKQSQSKLFAVGRYIVDAAKPGSMVRDATPAYLEFMSLLENETDARSIIEVMEYEDGQYLIPFEMADAMYTRLKNLNQINSFALRWFANMVLYYRSSGNQAFIEALLRQADNLEADNLSQN